MQEFFTFFATVIAVSASGVMAPGPLFASTISSGIKQKFAGLKIATGHAIVELPLVIMIGFGILSLESFSQFRTIVTILGAIGIFGFAALQIRAAFGKNSSGNTKHGAFLTGVILTGLNPFFLIWWFTIGIKIISDAMVLWSVWGILTMFVMHIWMDYAWLGIVSLISSRGTNFLAGKYYKIFMIAINAVLIYFGVSFVLTVI